VFVLVSRLLIEIFRLLLPWLLAAIRWLFWLMRFSLTATVNGPRQFVDRLASEWTRRVLVLGVPPIHIDNAFRLCRFCAASLVVLGWVATILFTGFILRIVFGFFI
jgi:hypothetical protein